MGDCRRFTVLAEFVARNFPPEEFQKVADVAGGSGQLSIELNKKGYNSTLIDPRKKVLKGISHKRKCWKSSMSDDYDLIVGLHPDETTEELCNSTYFRPIVLVPCCKHWKGIESHGSHSQKETVRRFFSKNRIVYRETVLKINGKNTVFWT